VSDMHILVTAGPTREALDPVRFLSNRSSGKMGFAIAAAAVARGHAVTLVSGPVALPPPDGVSYVSVESAQDMFVAVKAQVPDCDVLIMAAAVADWRPVQVSDQKLKKSSMDGVLHLERTPDILTSVQALKGSRVYVGFAAETQSVEAQARQKLNDKGLDLIVANDVSRDDAGFGVDTNVATLIARNGEAQSLPLMSKADLAEMILNRIEALLRG
jgi:phosphopantothenoylcysteine decarboxylase / phosphopantothenate---cysteine ligase